VHFELKKYQGPGNFIQHCATKLAEKVSQLQKNEDLKKTNLYLKVKVQFQALSENQDGEDMQINSHLHIIGQIY